MMAVPATPPAQWAPLRDGWPNAAHSHFVAVDSITWHVQRMGPTGAPRCLLVHGTGASTHSWGGLMPALADRFDCLAIDLPGHGFTAGAKGKMLTLPGMARALGALLEAEDFAPDLAIGHSAGAAILIQMALDALIAPETMIGLNSALEPIEGNAILSPLAKALFLNPFTAKTVAWQARYTPLPGRLLANTGTTLDDQGKAHYTKLMQMPPHVAGALGMMANWDLKPLQKRLPTLRIPMTLVVNDDDRMVPPRVSRQAAKSNERINVVAVPRGGHIAHEVDIGAYADLITDVAAQAGLLPAKAAAQ